MMSHGVATEDAILNANYVRACLKDVLSLPFGDPRLHARSAVRRPLPEGTHVSKLDFAKAPIDEGFLPDDGLFPARRLERNACGADRV